MKQQTSMVEVQAGVAAVAADFARDRAARQLRRHLDRADFDRLADAGFLLTGVPADNGGLWRSVQESTRDVAEMLRTLARGDPSVALVCAMHPAVLAFWLAQSEVPEEHAAAWSQQRSFETEAALQGQWWGTITSEPGSGGDVLKSTTRAARSGEGFALSGQKQFGSGSGIASYMITTAVPEGEAQPDWFFMRVADQSWDGSSGMKLTAEWDGHGMIATQSHAFEFNGFPATRIAWPGNVQGLTGAASAFIMTAFTAVVVGVTQAAFEAGRSQVYRRKDTLRPFELAEWAQVENEAWLIDQAYEAMLRAVEEKGSRAALDALHGKTAIANLAESLTQRMTHVIGGGTFHRGSAVGWAFEDVRALGFLRPPWGLAIDTLLDRTWERLAGPS